MSNHESYICLKCKRLACFHITDPQKCKQCGSDSFISVDRLVDEWPNSYKLFTTS